MSIYKAITKENENSLGVFGFPQTKFLKKSLRRLLQRLKESAFSPTLVILALNRENLLSYVAYRMATVNMNGLAVLFYKVLWKGTDFLSMWLLRVKTT